jgi:polysaccharide biosynthesis protein PslH
VVPLRVGGGTRIKIYEAMAMGLPVVSTSIGAEGLPLRNGEHLLIADTADQQVSAICTLLSDSARAELLALNALRHVRNCSWDAAAESFLSWCLRPVATAEPSYEGQAG